MYVCMQTLSKSSGLHRQTSRDKSLVLRKRCRRDIRIQLFNHSILNSLPLKYYSDVTLADCRRRSLLVHFTVVCSVTWLLNGSKAGGDLAVIQTFLPLLCKCTQLALKQFDLHQKSSEVCIKTRSPSASLPFKSQVTQQATVKWSNAIFQRDLALSTVQNGGHDVGKFYIWWNKGFPERKFSLI